MNASAHVLGSAWWILAGPCLAQIDAAVAHAVTAPPRPAAFVANIGQWEHGASFVASVGGATAFVDREGWTVVFANPPARRPATPLATLAGESSPVAPGLALRMDFVGKEGPEPRGMQMAAERRHFFLGSDPARWRTDVPCFASVRHEGVRPGLDVVLREQDRHFEFDVLFAPARPVEDFGMVVRGMDRVRLDGDGSLVLATSVGDVRMTPPRAWENGPDGARLPIACRFELRGDDGFGFAVGPRTPGRSLVIDPGLVWANAIAGSSSERAETLTTDAGGAAYVGGWTWSPNLPVTPGVFSVPFTGEDAFLCKYAPNGAVQFLTLLGGSIGTSPFGPDLDEILGVAVDAQGAITVVGRTACTNFPATPGAFQQTLPCFIAGFVTRFTASGASLVYSTYLGGYGMSSSAAARGVALDYQGLAIVVGTTNSNSFPVSASAFQGTYGGGNEDGFVSVIAPNGGGIWYSSFLGGSLSDELEAVAIDGAGSFTVTGSTQSANFPTTPGAFDTTYNSGTWPWDAFVTRFPAVGTASGVLYSTFLGGVDNDLAYAVTLDAQGAAIVTGWTLSVNFPTTPGTLGTFHGAEDVFVSKLSANGAALIASTLLGSSSGELGMGVAVDARGDVTVVGWTGSTSFPTTPGAHSTVHSSGSQTNDAFVTRLSHDMTHLVYSSFLGITTGAMARGVALGPAGDATIAWNTSDVSVTRLDMLPSGASAHGASSPGCRGPLAIGVSSMPQVGNSLFTITCGNASPGSLGALAFAGASLASPVPVLGVDIWVDPGQLILLATATSDAAGAADVPLPIPANPSLAFMHLAAQFVWFGPTAPPPCPFLGTSAANALDLVIQP